MVCIPYEHFHLNDLWLCQHLEDTSNYVACPEGGEPGLDAAAAGVAVEAVNLETETPEAVNDILKRCQGFAIGSPTLGGHMPTQVLTGLQQPCMMGLCPCTERMSPCRGPLPWYGTCLWWLAACSLIASACR